MAPTRNRRARPADPPLPIAAPRIYVKQFERNGPWHVILVEPWGKPWGQETDMGHDADQGHARRLAEAVALEHGVAADALFINPPLHDGIANGIHRG